MAATDVVTADDLLAMPRGQVRRELVAGELREMSPTGAEHGRVAALIGAMLLKAAGDAGVVFAAGTGFIIARDPDTVRAPDAALVRAEHARRVGTTARYWPGPPDLAVEVVSPNDTYAELSAKALAWLAAGATLVLVAEPAPRRVTRYASPGKLTVLEGDQPVDCNAVLDGFAPPARSLFPTT